MTKYICIKKCFYQVRLWTPGETLDVPEGVKDVPEKCFKLKTKDNMDKLHPNAKEEIERLSLFEKEKADQEAMAKAVGGEAPKTFVDAMKAIAEDKKKEEAKKEPEEDLGFLD